jgi:PAS domain S-box-containing protein
MVILAIIIYISYPNNILIFVSIAAAFLAGYLINSFLAGRFIKKPVSEMVDAMNRLAEKKYDFRLDENENDEFGSLASSFNDMASLISSSLTELEKSRDYLRGILESSADIIVTVNPSGNIMTINMGVTNVLGYRREDVIGKSVDILLANPIERRIAGERLKHTDNVVNYETQFLTKKGETRDILLTLSQMRNSTGSIIGTIVFSKDITREKRLQKQLIQSQRFATIGQVFTGIQHSMKNMLNACQGGAYMVRTGLSKDNRKMLEDGWNMVQEGIDRLTDMSKDMLRYVKEWVPRFDRVDLTETITGIYNVVKQSAMDKGVELKLDIAPDISPVSCDAKMMHSAVMDIVSNAIDACVWKEYSDSEKPQVTLGAYSDTETNKLVINVIDNGIGMTDEVKANIFDPFFSTKSKAGTGLGLSITSKMIGFHNGRIDVDSIPNRGTTFRIVLPLNGADKYKEEYDGQESSGSR